MKAPRISLRALMIVVALAALASWGWVLRQRSARFAAEANKHYTRLEVCIHNRDAHLYDGHLLPRVRRLHLMEGDKEQVKFFQSWVCYEEQLVSKYRWAAIFPWLSPGDDPPPPSSFHSWLY